MLWKENGHSFGVFLIYTIAVIRLPAGGWCETPPAKSNSHLAAHHALTTNSIGYRTEGDGARGQQLGPRQAEEEASHFPVLHHLGNRDESQTESPGGGRPVQRMRTVMAPPSNDHLFENLHKSTADGWRLFPSLGPADEHCGPGRVQRVVHGSFYITGQLEVNVPRVESQSDRGPPGEPPGRAGMIWDQQVGGSEESWRRLQPVVECGAAAMTLTVRRGRAVQLRLDRGKESPVPLSQLPPQCGYSVQTTSGDLGLRVQYNGCHVAHEDGRHVLRLLWRGTRLEVSCPVHRLLPQDSGRFTLCCSSSGVTVRVQGPPAAEELRVKVRGRWTPLMEAAVQCGYTLDRQRAERVISAPFAACGITVRHGEHTLCLQTGEGMFTLSCPVSPSHEDLLQTQEPLPDISHYRTRELRAALPDSSEPFPWAPPFYLAPLDFPHPRSRKHSRPYGHDVYNPFAPHPLLDSQDFPQIQRRSNKHSSPDGSLSATDEMIDLSPVHPDVQQTEETPVLDVPESSSATASSFLTEEPPLQPPTYPFHPYYHYYHHPKIPLPFPPRLPDPAPEVATEFSTNPHDEIPGLPVCDQESDVNSNLLPHPVFWTPYIFSTGPEFIPQSPEPYAYYPPPPHPPFLPPPQPYPHPFYYFPYISNDAAKNVLPLHPDMAAEMNVSDVPSLAHEYDARPFINPLNGRKKEERPPFPGAAVKPALDDAPATPRPQSYSPKPHLLFPRPGQPSVSAPPSDHRLAPYPSLFFPGFPYDSGPGAEHQPSLAPAKPPTSAPATISQFAALNPYYHYSHQNHRPEQDVHPGAAGSLLQSGNGRLDHPARADEAGNSGRPPPPYDPFRSFFPHHPYDLPEHRSGEKDRLEAGAPVAPPRVLDSVSGSGCRNSPGAYSYHVRDCTVGRHLVLVVPDWVLEPTLARVAGNASCSLEKLTSDPDVYMVPLVGCGVTKHVFGDVVVHRSEVRGVDSRRADDTCGQQTSPVRFMVECISSPGSPGEVRLHVTGQPPPPPLVTVQLRIGTDQSYASYHPETRLPLSLLRGKPVFLEVSLLDPPGPDLVLLVHSCLAYMHTPFISWLPVYDGCSSQSKLQLLPSPRSGHIRRIAVSSFLSLPSEAPSDTDRGGSSHLQDPEIYFLCWTEVCFSADDDCAVSCGNGRFST